MGQRENEEIKKDHINYNNTIIKRKMKLNMAQLHLIPWQPLPTATTMFSHLPSALFLLETPKPLYSLILPLSTYNQNKLHFQTEYVCVCEQERERKRLYAHTCVFDVFTNGEKQAMSS